MLGKPKFTYGDEVSFMFCNETLTGEIEIVDAYGTFFQDEEPSYDIMVENDNTRCLYKHIPESFVIDKLKRDGVS